MRVENIQSEQRGVAIGGSFDGNCITGDNNQFHNYYIMSDKLNESIIALANSQSKLADALADAMSKRSEADLIKVKTDKQCADNYALELKIREKEADNNSTLITSIQSTLEKINDKLDK